MIELLLLASAGLASPAVDTGNLDDEGGTFDLEKPEDGGDDFLEMIARDDFVIIEEMRDLKIVPDTDADPIIEEDLIVMTEVVPTVIEDLMDGKVASPDIVINDIIIAEEVMVRAESDPIIFQDYLDDKVAPDNTDPVRVTALEMNKGDLINKVQEGAGQLIVNVDIMEVREAAEDYIIIEDFVDDYHAMNKGDLINKVQEGAGLKSVDDFVIIEEQVMLNQENDPIIWEDHLANRFAPVDGVNGETKSFTGIEDMDMGRAAADEFIIIEEHVMIKQGVDPIVIEDALEVRAAVDDYIVIEDIVMVKTLEMGVPGDNAPADVLANMDYDAIDGAPEEKESAIIITDIQAIRAMEMNKGDLINKVQKVRVDLS